MIVPLRRIMGGGRGGGGRIQQSSCSKLLSFSLALSSPTLSVPDKSKDLYILTAAAQHILTYSVLLQVLAQVIKKLKLEIWMKHKNSQPVNSRQICCMIFFFHCAFNQSICMQLTYVFLLIHNNRTVFIIEQQEFCQTSAECEAKVSSGTA